VPSVKNFKLHLALPSSYDHRATAIAAAGGSAAAAAAQEVSLLSMHKVGKDNYFVTFSQPFCFIQAFGVALSRFETKQSR